MHADRTAMTPLRVAIVADLTEERWPSMDFVAAMLAAHLSTLPADEGIHVELLRPTLPSRGRQVGRFINRFWDYARWLRAHAGSHDVFHIIDHSYAHLVHVLPAARTVVTCHDVDAFLPLVDPNLSVSRLPRLLVRASLSGLRRAARVACVSQATCDDLRRYRLVSPQRLEVVPNGTSAIFGDTADPGADAEIACLLGRPERGRIDLLHVGSTIPRKRIDLLLRIVAAVRDVEPRVRLVKAGGALTNEQRELAGRLGLEGHLLQVPFLETPALAALYRRAAVVLVTSEREGFGLPIVEALAAGTPAVVTDLPVLREVGGHATRYRPLGDVEGWRDEVLDVFRQRSRPACHNDWRAAASDQARRFSWDANAASMLRIYRAIASNADLTRVRP